VCNYSSSREPISECLNPSQALDIPTPEGWKAELSWYKQSDRDCSLVDVCINLLSCPNPNHDKFITQPIICLYCPTIFTLCFAIVFCFGFNEARLLHFHPMLCSLLENRCWCFITQNGLCFTYLIAWYFSSVSQSCSSMQWFVFAVL